MSDATQLPPTSPYSAGAIFSRTVEQSGSITPELAEHILSLDISENDRKRVDELLKRNSDGLLTAEEQQELENLNHVADLISLWHYRARKVLQNS